MSLPITLFPTPGPDGHSLAWARADADAVLDAVSPVVVETDGRRMERGYDRIDADPDDGLLALVDVRLADGTGLSVRDQWRQVDPTRWRLDRHVSVVTAGPDSAVRVLFEMRSRLGDFGRHRFFAPGAMYDLNDLDGDFVDDYAGTSVLHYREDRLSALSVLAHHDGAGLAISLSRADVPLADGPLDRAPGDTVVRQRTDIGSLGVEPVVGGARLVAAYPFVERDRSHALLVKQRPGWGAFRPVQAGEEFDVSYDVVIAEAATPHDALAELWRRRLVDLAPVAVALPVTLAEISDHRMDALLDYYRDDDETAAAGFVTNCHPQDGVQLGDVIQYGFTGQNLLNAFNLLRAKDRPNASAERKKALRVIDFYVSKADARGFVPGLYILGERRYASWWTGLLLPLAYAAPGEDLERLMGPLLEHLRPVVDSLRGRDGVYLRCLAEEHDALLSAYELEAAQGRLHPEWLDTVQRFGRFLLDVQRPDGAWCRAYDFEGRALTEPDFWFGNTDVQQTSSTATVIPLLLALHRVTAGAEWLAAATLAGEYVRGAFVDGLKFNGGIHDSMYARPQLVDHESIVFCLRALLDLHRATGSSEHVEAATRAAWIACSWTWLWDVPLPPESTFARNGFRSTGWTGCDAPGAGYIHPMGLIMVPDLVELATLTGEQAFLATAELVLMACNENVAVPGHDWGYARNGLQEEGLQISWCWIDDPMFVGTEFGGRGKGEGNKTCFPWIPAVTVWAHQEMLARYGTADVRSAGASSPAGIGR